MKISTIPELFHPNFILYSGVPPVNEGTQPTPLTIEKHLLCGSILDVVGCNYQIRRRTSDIRTRKQDIRTRKQDINFLCRSTLKLTIFRDQTHLKHTATKFSIHPYAILVCNGGVRAVSSDRLTMHTENTSYYKSSSLIILLRGHEFIDSLARLLHTF